jgi:hypothetical protein
MSARVLKYQKKKQSTFNRMLGELMYCNKPDYIQYYVNYIKSYVIDILPHKEGEIGALEYKVKKELNTETWLLCFNNFAVYNLKHADLEEFIFNNSVLLSNVVFHVYANSSHFVLFCVTHHLSDIPSINITNRKSDLLFNIFGNFIILNNSYKNKLKNQRSIQTNQLIFHSEIGTGATDHNLLKVIRFSQDLLHIHRHHPPHYLSW